MKEQHARDGEFHDFGDAASHLLKTGSVARQPETVDPLRGIVDALGTSFRGVPIEYDLTYPGEPDVITGYAYNEIMRGIQIHPMGSEWIERHAAAVAAWPDESPAVADEIMARNGDKYVMDMPDDLSGVDRVAFLPGSNRIDDTDLKRVDDLVADGWLVKPHPLTQPRTTASLQRRFGTRAVLGRRVSGWAVYRACEQVATMRNTEFGILALLEGKPWTPLDLPGRPRRPTSYARFYAVALDAHRHASTPQRMLRRMLNCPFSGLILPWREDRFERIEAFFDFFADAPHGRRTRDGRRG